MAHFVNQLVFCFFADSVGLLPNGVWKKLLLRAEDRPTSAKKNLDRLFEKMRTGGEFDLYDIGAIDSALFDGRCAMDLAAAEIDILMDSRLFDWRLIDPAVLGSTACSP